MSKSLMTCTFGGGCFWCLEAVFQGMKGVERVVSGYAGGRVRNPTYREVCSGLTGHAEVVQLGFDPDIVSYRELLEVFFAIHDPTSLNRQGADVGTQYRSAIFYHDETQRETAATMIADLETRGVYEDPIVTELAPLDTFFPAEDYHQNYFRDNASQPYCQYVVAPKVESFRRSFTAWRRDGRQ